VNINKIMKQAQKMQEAIAALEVTGQAGGGVVTVTMTGAKHLVGVKLDPEAIDPEDPSLLEDLILAAVNDAERKVEQEISGKMGGVLPGGLGGLI
jgi:DNA-binding YbaB/EbfC family protein